MLTARRFRLIALAALASFAFAQAATAAMGCATLRADSTQGNVAVMPSGEPCDLMGALPAPMTLKAFAPDASTAQHDDKPQQPANPAPGFLTIALPGTPGPHRLAAPLAARPRILGPPSHPPYLATLRLRV